MQKQQSLGGAEQGPGSLDPHLLRSEASLVVLCSRWFGTTAEGAAQVAEPRPGQKDVPEEPDPERPVNGDEHSESAEQGDAPCRGKAEARAVMAARRSKVATLKLVSQMLADEQ